MAKQSGIHQIKGKIGEHSYYRQTGVSGGLIRSINQGLSARVKSDAAYANTRLNNQEFGAAANTAALLGKMVVPKFRPMILPFSQSKMAKEILKLARQNVSPWGQRTVSSSQTAQIAATLAAMSKRDSSEFVGFELSFAGDNAFDIDYNITAEQATLLAGLGVTRVAFRLAFYNLATGNYNAITGEMATGYVELADALNNETAAIVAGTPISDTESMNCPVFIPESGHSGHQIFVAVIMPLREIDGVSHILQEYCSFTASVLPARE